MASGHGRSGSISRSFVAVAIGPARSSRGESTTESGERADLASAVKLEKLQMSAIDRGRAKPGSAAISPKVKSWIDNVIVPALVEQFLAEQSSEKSLAEKPKPFVISSAP